MAGRGRNQVTRDKGRWNILFYLALVLCVGLFLTARSEEVDSPIIGIDLGTTHSCVAVMRNGRVEIIPNDQGNRTTPSWVAFTDDGRLIGNAAKDQFLSNPHRTIYDVKRIIGRNISEVDVQKNLRTFPFEVVESNGIPKVHVEVQGQKEEYSPEEVSAMILGKMRDIAEAYLGEKVTRAVVTVPAYFNEAQRAATKDAGTIAGLDILRIFNESTAAALAYDLDKINNSERQVLVYDLGGGTFDVTIFSIEEGVFEILATAGDMHLGGEDFDQQVVDYFVKKYNKENDVDIRKDTTTMRKLKREVERAKRVLSFETTTKIEIETFHDGNDFSETLTRARFEELNNSLFEKTLKSVEQALKDAKFKKSDIDDIVLAGGSSHIPKVQSMVEEFFGKPAQKSINPDEVVAHGAAVMGGVISEPRVGCPLLEVNPSTLGIETTGGLMAPIIKRGTTLPTHKSLIFSTAVDNQTTVLIQVYAGERSLTKDNHFLGKFELQNIPPAPRGVPQIEVSFELEEDDLMHDGARDEATGKTQSITIEHDKGRLSWEDIERMVEEGEEYAEEDQANRKRIEARYGGENYGFSLEGHVKLVYPISSKAYDRIVEGEVGEPSVHDEL
ncbi:78 kDa glucose-regulated protein precursor [Cucurbitaria berberidis CBS 394.84]|uniref:78 kDa glucose-regulated protein n=1 Tax=Cucurbitaria berberidis CBS 394.84 TaxID=1168544 RepID=A0A9P4GIE0_9PLEO|nr:78 kDa glucose-regulated protein precursor [Cucurbitaria berberidis CBS 394.84]KAF1845986.1 78 kDa glucose-regulated protein precursor [Cucurbitaria berberidis CBS 394.84]